MRRVKFINKDKAQFANALKKNVNAYFDNNGISQKGNWKMLLKAATMVALYFGPFLLILFLPMADWLIIPLSLTMGIGMAGLGMSVMHDAAHGSFSNVSWLNRFFSNAMYSIGGNSFNWKVQHNILHHTYTNIEGVDEDIDPKGLLRLNAQTPLKRVHKFQYIYAFFLYCLMTLARTVNEFRQLNKYNKSGITTQQGSTPKKEMFRLILSKTIYLLIILGLPLLFSSFNGWLIILNFLLMHFVGGIFMSTVFQMAHIVEEAKQPVPDETGCIDNEWAVHELETTVNFARKSRLFGWMIGGLNYQIEHHLFPHISHIHYRAISPIVKKTASDFGLRYNENRTFLSAISSHIRLLKRLGQE